MKKIITLILLITVLLTVGIFFLFKAETDESNIVACTMEALICPDGSGVGRTGPDCEFLACPNQDSFVGEFDEAGGEYRLIVATPENLTGATYVIPLDLGNITDTQKFLGKRVAVRGAFTTGINLKVENIDFVSESDGTQTMGTVRVGETKLINRVKVTLNKIVGDSRCPIDVVCIQAGDVTLNVTLQSDTDTETIDLKTDNEPHTFDSFRISIESVLPTPISSVVSNFSKYEVKFRVENVNNI